MQSRDRIKQFREMDVHDLKERLGELKQELFNLRFQAATTQLSSPARFKLVRNEIAQILTVAHERNLSIR